ncbi:hypothetical protein, partial [Staphylococcus aureus]
TIKLITGNQLIFLLCGNEKPANMLQHKAKIIRSQIIASGTVEFMALYRNVIESFTLIKDCINCKAA